MAVEAKGCPRCGADNMQEQSYRYTFQTVYGLDAEGDGADYDSFDYGDDVWVIGWECRSCQWAAIGDEGPVAAALEAAREDAGRKLAAAHELRAGIENASYKEVDRKSVV